MPTSGGSAAPFNGGTITQELAVSPSAFTNGSLLVTSPAHEALSALVFRVANADGDNTLNVYSDSTIEVQNNVADGNAPGGAFVVTDLGPVLNTNFIIKGSRGSASGGVGGGGYLKMRGVIVAPADTTLLAGDVALWFDRTNAASKLMIKGKSADGTVVTGSVSLT